MIIIILYQISGVLAIQRTDVCLQITGKTEEPTYSNAETVRAVITCFLFRIANNILPLRLTSGVSTELPEQH